MARDPKPLRPGHSAPVQRKAEGFLQESGLGSLTGSAEALTCPSTGHVGRIAPSTPQGDFVRTEQIVTISDVQHDSIASLGDRDRKQVTPAGGVMGLGHQEGVHAMLVDVSVPEQVESKLRRKVAAQGQDLSEYLQRVIVEAAEDDLPMPPASENTAKYMARLRAMIERHAVRCGHVDDSRESIYAGCGE